MGSTLWVLKEGQEEDNWDHSQILKEESRLNKLAKKLNISKFSDLLDYSVLSEEYGVSDTVPNYLEPRHLIETLETYISHISDGSSVKFKETPELLEELKDCLTKAKEAHTENCKLRLSIVP